jgi:hypothetical protein
VAQIGRQRGYFHLATRGDDTKGSREYQGVTVRQWITADARDLATVLPEVVDFVLLANTLHGVPDKPALVQAIAAVLRPDRLTRAAL